MKINFHEDRSLAKRPRLQSTCIQLHELAQKLGPEARLPTIAELRARFDVSTYTLNEAVRELERRRVLRSVNGVGIFVTSQKRMLTGNIGLIGSSSLHQQQTSYYSQLVRGMEIATVENGQNLLFLGTGLTWSRKACDKVDGILIAGIEQLPELIKQLPQELPVVTALTSLENVPSVVGDDYHGAKMVVQHLLQHGHRRIACLLEELPSLPRRRFAGYKDALQDAGIETNTQWMRLTPRVDNTSTQNYRIWGHEEMTKWLRTDWDATACTAIFVQNETAAIGVMHSLQEAGIEVPGRVSVVGFDGTELCDYVMPRLTAMQVPLAQIGAKAVHLLDQIIRDHSTESTALTLPLTLKEGYSVKTVSAPRYADTVA